MLHYNVEELARAFGSEADQIRKRSGVFGWKANGPAPTVSDIIAQAKDLDGMGFPIRSARTIAAIGLVYR